MKYRNLIWLPNIFPDLGLVGCEGKGAGFKEKNFRLSLYARQKYNLFPGGGG